VGGYHLVNVAIHLLCALLLFGIARRTLRTPVVGDALAGRSTLLAFATALVWTLHPLGSEAVDFLTQRTESLMAMFYLLTLYASLRGRGRTGSRAWTALAIASCALGMGCKESMATAPLMVAIYDRIFIFDSWEQAWRKRRGFYAGLVATWLVLAVLVSSGPRGGSAGFASGVTPWMYLLNQARLIVRYLGLAIWPRGLVLNYGPPVPLTVADVLPQALFILVLVLLTAVAVVRRPALGFLGAWFFITLAPASSVIPIATEVGAERRMYLPLMALAAAFVLGCRLFLDRMERALNEGEQPGVRAAHRIAMAAAAILLASTSIALGAATMMRNREYRSGVAMAETLLARLPSSHSQHIMGQELMAVGRHEEAMAFFREAAKGDPRAHYNLGLELFNQQRFDEALPEFRQFVEQAPLLLEAVDARMMMGQIYARQQRWPEATAEFRKVLAMDGSKSDVRGLLADALSAQQLYDEAIPQYQDYLKRHPDETGPLSSLGIALAARGRTEEAVAAFERAAKADPRNPSVLANLANALLSKGDFAGAANHARAAVRLTPRSAVAHEVLGLALAGQGLLDQARVELQQAIQLDPGNAEIRESLNEILRRR
jgi:tetratricopeptide (TPR) repeat protein